MMPKPNHQPRAIADLCLIRPGHTLSCAQVIDNSSRVGPCLVLAAPTFAADLRFAGLPLTPGGTVSAERYL